MPREPLRLTEHTLAAYRSGALVAVADGGLADVPRKRPVPYALRGHGLRARAYELGGNRTGAAPPAAPETAIIPIRGVLEQRGSMWDCGETCGYDTIEADVLGALSDPGVGQGVVDIDSNGGDVAGIEQAILRIRAGVAAIGKPLVAYVNEKCFSAAFWLAAGICDAIYLPPAGRIGSVGSCVIVENCAGHLAKEGRVVYIGRRPGGKYKPNDVEPLDDIGRARIDRLADEGAVRFFAAIEATRGVPADVAEGWNGDTFTGQAAVDAGLADGVGSMDEVIALAEGWPRREAA